MRAPHRAGLRPGPVFALAALATALLAGRIAAGDLVGDPVLYAALAKAILRRGDWGTLYLAGEPFFLKPPLVLWLTALSFKAFGVATWSARLVGAVSGVLACLVLARLGTVLAGPEVGIAAGAVLALTPGFVRFSSTLLLDPTMLLAALLGLLCVARTWEHGGAGLRGGRTSRRAERGLAVRLLVVWTALAYGTLLIVAKHSPRYLMLLHPAVALWAALAVTPWLGRRVAPAVTVLAGLAWLTVVFWPGSLHPSGT